MQYCTRLLLQATEGRRIVVDNQLWVITDEDTLTRFTTTRIIKPMDLYSLFLKVF